MSPFSRAGARPSRSRAEQLSFATASAVLLAIAGTIAVLWAQEARPPELTASVIGEPRTSGGRTYVTAEVHNGGTTAAVDVQVVAEQVEGGEPTPVGEQAVNFLAGGASSTVVFLLRTPDLTGLTIRVESYTVSR